MLGVKYHSVLMRSGRVLNEAGRRVAGSGSWQLIHICFTFISWFLFDLEGLFVIFYPLLHLSGCAGAVDGSQEPGSVFLGPRGSRSLST